MRLGIMQPYFFPYLGHFSLIAHVDKWIVFDISQYTHKSWLTRNRVLHPGGGWNWINVPLSNGSIGIRIAEARVLDPVATEKSLLGKLSHYRRKAPFHREVETLVREAFALPPGDRSLVNLNVRALDVVCRYLGLPFDVEICSAMMGLRFPPALGPGDWALEICAALGATAYLNPISGQALFDAERFRGRGIALKFLTPQPFHYDTGPYRPIADLSILDVLMWNDPARVRSAIRDLATIAAPN